MTEEKEESFSVLITGFKNKEEAEEFIMWYSHQGEQASPYWLEESALTKPVRTNLNCDCGKTYPIQFKGNTALMYIQED